MITRNGLSRERRSFKEVEKVDLRGENWPISFRFLIYYAALPLKVLPYAIRLFPGLQS